MINAQNDEMEQWLPNPCGRHKSFPEMQWLPAGTVRRVCAACLRPFASREGSLTCPTCMIRRKNPGAYGKKKPTSFSPFDPQGGSGGLGAVRRLLNRG